MIVYPAIDILGGQAVQLRQGDFGRSRVYVQDPLEAAQRWISDGARALHVVDLDGAREGRPVSTEHLRRIAAEVSIPVQYGGGLRSADDVAAAFDAGAARVVLGTAAFTDPDLLTHVLERWRRDVAVAIDVRGGRVSTSGWVEQLDMDGAEAVGWLRERGVGNLIYTSVDRDGTLTGLDPVEVRRVSEAVGGDRFLYSGGIGSLEDVRVLAALRLDNLGGVVVGKALYEGRLKLVDAQQALDEGGARPSS